MIGRLLFFVVGLLTGICIVVVVDLRTDHSTNTILTGSETEQSEGDLDRSNAALVGAEESPSPIAAPTATDQDVVRPRPIDHSDIRMPSIYKEKIGPVYPRRPTFPERHEMFVSEIRDEPWAFAMETGLADYFSEHAPQLGIVFEYIECRAMTCEIAGYTLKGRDDDTGQIHKVTEQPWWQGGSAVSSYGFEVDGTDYFVTIIYHGKRYTQ